MLEGGYYERIGTAIPGSIPDSRSAGNSQPVVAGSLFPLLQCKKRHQPKPVALLKASRKIDWMGHMHSHSGMKLFQPLANCVDAVLIEAHRDAVRHDVVEEVPVEPKDAANASRRLVAP